MLILTHRPSETLIIKTPSGERITVTVMEVKGNQVRIGTNAPADISIVQEELLEKAWRSRPVPVIQENFLNGNYSATNGHFFSCASGSILETVLPAPHHSPSGFELRPVQVLPGRGTGFDAKRVPVMNTTLGNIVHPR